MNLVDKREVADHLRIGSDLILIFLFALAIRLIFFNGMFGSDDVVYYARSLQLARGDWSSANYNGALRYGFNLPAAGFMALFGTSVFVANLWPLTCSLVEIGAVYIFANAAMSRTTGVAAALLLAATPLHIAVATRVHADPVVAMFVTLGFVLLYFGAVNRRQAVLFASGLAIGGIFWAKELAAVTWFAFLPMLWFFRGHLRNSLWVLAGGVLMMLVHGSLMATIAGDPLHLIKLVLRAVKTSFIDGGKGEDSAGYYLHYLFRDVRHTGLLAIIALASTLGVSKWLTEHNMAKTPFAYAIIWWICLVGVLSLFPVSLAPLRFTMKQSNYMSLFLAPTSILAGMAIATFPRAIGAITVGLCVGLGIFLGALQQADYRAFTSNSKALATFLIEHPNSMIVGSTNNSSLGNLWAILEFQDAPRTNIISFKEVFEKPFGAIASEGQAVFAVLDPQTMNWFSGKAPVTTPLPCWKYELKLKPENLGFGNKIAGWANDIVGLVGHRLSTLDHLSNPQDAEVYRVSGRDPLCRDVGR